MYFDRRRNAPNTVLEELALPCKIVKSKQTITRTFNTISQLPANLRRDSKRNVNFRNRLHVFVYGI